MSTPDDASEDPVTARPHAAQDSAGARPSEHPAGQTLRQLLVTGPHRSGTSALAATLVELGYFPGAPLLPAVAGVNDNGFFEDQLIVDLNDRILRDLGRDWRSPQPLAADWHLTASAAHADRIKALADARLEHPAWFIKDPRLCLLLPLWLRAAPGAAVIICLREPAAAIDSLIARDNLPAAHAEFLWLQHALAAERTSRGQPRRFVRYEALLRDPTRTLREIADWTGAAYRPAAARVVAPELRRHSGRDRSLQPLTRALAATLNLLADSDTAQHRARLDSLGNKLEANPLWHRVLAAHDSGQRALEASHLEAARQLRAKDAAIEASIAANGRAAAAVKRADARLQGASDSTQLAATQARLETRFAEQGSTAAPSADPATSSGSDAAPTPRVDLRVDNNSHTRVVRYVRGFAATRSLRVLEVGCASGYFGAALRTEGHSVWGVEPDPVAADAARAQLDRVSCANIEAFLLDEDTADERFDVIVLGDVLEHLVEPEAVLRACRSRLAPDGAIALSIPNVAYGPVRLMLLAGRWQYSDRGILDRTHLRFFTRASLLDLVERCGLQAERFSAITLPAELAGIDVDPKLARVAADWVNDPDAEAFQFVSLLRAHRAPAHEGFREPQRLLCLPPLASSNLYRIRLQDPLRAYAEQRGATLRLGSLRDPQSADIDWAEVAVLQREADEETLTLTRALQARGVPVVFDIDDLLLDVPEHLGAHRHCEAMRPLLLELLTTVDAISVSTPDLADAIQQRLREAGKTAPPLVITPNTAWSGERPIRHPGRAPVRVIVASSDSVTVEMLAPALRRITALTTRGGTPAIELVGIGPPGHMLRGLGLPIAIADVMPLDQFKAYIASRDDTIALLPLDDTDFNRCKSAIKFYDYALAGVPCICSRVTPYSSALEDGVEGLLVDEGSESDGTSANAWFDAIARLVGDAELRESLADAARNRVLRDHHPGVSGDAWRSAIAAASAQRQARATGATDTDPPPEPIIGPRSVRWHLLRRGSYETALHVYRTEGVRGVGRRLARLLRGRD
ncbi:MAG: methyltransferase domain-containing protein [Pseudomonadota bacterium]